MALRSGASRLAALAFAAVGCAETIGSETIASHPDVCGPRSGRGSPHTFAAPGRRGAAVQDLDVHPAIDAYRESLRSFLDAREAAMLDQVDWSGTTGGDTQRLRDLAADRALRRILPLLLESERSPVLDAHAARLRALPPRLNRDTDVVAHLAVAEAMAALERFSAASIPFHRSHGHRRDISAVFRPGTRKSKPQRARSHCSDGHARRSSMSREKRRLPKRSRSTLRNPRASTESRRSEAPPRRQPPPTRSMSGFWSAVCSSTLAPCANARLRTLAYCADACSRKP